MTEGFDVQLKKLLLLKNNNFRGIIHCRAPSCACAHPDSLPIYEFQDSWMHSEAGLISTRNSSQSLQLILNLT